MQSQYSLEEDPEMIRAGEEESILVACRLAVPISGIALESTTRRFFTPYTLRSVSTTPFMAAGSTILVSKLYFRIPFKNVTRDLCRRDFAM